jgi:hypothetical protein
MLDATTTENVQLLYCIASRQSFSIAGRLNKHQHESRLDSSEHLDQVSNKDSFNSIARASNYLTVDRRKGTKIVQDDGVLER